MSVGTGLGLGDTPGTTDEQRAIKERYRWLSERHAVDRLHLKGLFSALGDRIILQPITMKDVRGGGDEGASRIEVVQHNTALEAALAYRVVRAGPDVKDERLKVPGTVVIQDATMSQIIEAEVGGRTQMVREKDIASVLDDEAQAQAWFDSLIAERDAAVAAEVAAQKAIEEERERMREARNVAV